MKAIHMREHGGPGVLKFEDVGEAFLLVGVGNTGLSPHLPADRQGPAAVSDSCHQNLSFPG